MGQELANLIPRFEHREGIQYEADGDTGGSTGQEISRACENGENGRVPFGVLFADGSEEGGDCHEAAHLIESCHVERNSGNVAAIVFFLKKRELIKFRETHRINVADVPRQRPCTPEEEMIALAVERMVPCCLDRRKSKLFVRKKNTAYFSPSAASPCCRRVFIRSTEDR